MTDVIEWAEPETVTLRGRLRPDFVDDNRYTAAWCGQNAGFGSPAHQWRSYSRHGEEVARMLLSLYFTSHSPDSSVPALMVWNFEVREDLRRSGLHIGTTIVEELAVEYHDREIYVGPTFESVTFWARFQWPMCDCEQCDSRDFRVCRP